MIEERMVFGGIKGDGQYQVFYSPTLDWTVVVYIEENPEWETFEEQYIRRAVIIKGKVGEEHEDKIYFEKFDEFEVLADFEW